MKIHHKIFNFLLLVILSTNISGGSFLLKNFLEQNKKYDIQPKPAALANAVSLKMMHDFYPKNQIQPSLQYFPLEKLPRDTQNEIASYLKFNKFESDEELINVLRKKELAKKNYVDVDIARGIVLEGRDIKNVDIKEAEHIFKKNDTTQIICIYGFPKLIYLAKISPNFKKLILYIESGWGYLNIFDLKENLKPYVFPYCENGEFTEIKEIDQIAIADDGSFAYSDYRGIYWHDINKNKFYRHLKRKDSECLKKIKHPPMLLIDKLEFNKQGTKLGVKYKDGKTEILSLPGKEKKQKTLQQYFYENIITKNLKHHASS